jgi:hypothetical protein
MSRRRRLEWLERCLTHGRKPYRAYRRTLTALGWNDDAKSARAQAHDLWARYRARGNA